MRGRDWQEFDREGSRCDPIIAGAHEGLNAQEAGVGSAAVVVESADALPVGREVFGEECLHLLAGLLRFGRVVEIHG